MLQRFLSALDLQMVGRRGTVKELARQPIVLMDFLCYLLGWLLTVV